jgi:hypothetical protein
MDLWRTLRGLQHEIRIKKEGVDHYLAKERQD